MFKLRRPWGSQLHLGMSSVHLWKVAVPEQLIALAIILILALIQQTCGGVLGKSQGCWHSQDPKLVHDGFWHDWLGRPLGYCCRVLDHQEDTDLRAVCLWSAWESHLWSHTWRQVFGAPLFSSRRSWCVELERHLQAWVRKHHAESDLGKSVQNILNIDLSRAWHLALISAEEFLQPSWELYPCQVTSV